MILLVDHSQAFIQFVARGTRLPRQGQNGLIATRLLSRLCARQRQDYWINDVLVMTDPSEWYIYLEPVCPLFWRLNPKEGLFQPEQGSFGTYTRR